MKLVAVRSAVWAITELLQYDPILRGLKPWLSSSLIRQIGSITIWPDSKGIETSKSKTELLHYRLLQYDPILRGLKHTNRFFSKRNNAILQYDPILRGLKPSNVFFRKFKYFLITIWPDSKGIETLTNLIPIEPFLFELQYDPILRGLKLFWFFIYIK